MLAHSVSLGIIAVIFPAYVNVDMIYFVIGFLLLTVGGYYLFVLPKLIKKHVRTAGNNTLLQ
jgi:hypothetical protein